MTPDPVALLTALGLGKYAAACVALVMCIGYLITWIAPVLPKVPPSGFFSLFVYNIVQKIAANVGNAKNANAPEADTVIKVPVMMLPFFALAIALSACAMLPSLISTGVTLATVAAQHNTTAAAIVTDGAIICGKLDSTTGKLAVAGLVAVADMSGLPVSVTNIPGDVVATVCPAVGLVAGALPAGVDAATVPVVTTPAAAVLPPAASVAAAS